VSLAPTSLSPTSIAIRERRTSPSHTMGAVRSFVRTERISTLFLTPSATLHPQRRRAQMVVRSLGRTARAEEGISPSSSPQASFQTSSRGLGVSASDSALSASSARSAVASCRHHCETGQPSHLRVGVGHPLSPRKHCTTGVPAALFSAIGVQRVATRLCHRGCLHARQARLREHSDPARVD
jgi:hypothetical protein